VFVETDAQNVTVSPGERAVLNCRVQQLGDKTVRRVKPIISTPEVSS